MPYRISSGVPSDRFRRTLSKLLALPHEQSLRLVNWLATSENPLPTNAKELARLSEATGIEDRDLNDIFSAVSFVMVGWRRNELTLDEVLVDLATLGLTEDDLERAKEIFSKLEVTKEQFFAVTMRRTFEKNGLPTIDDLNFIWDLRPIFGRTVYPVDDGADENVGDWISHTYILLFEMIYSGSRTEEQSLSVQMSEKDFDNLERAISRARKQLESLKSKRIV